MAYFVKLRDVLRYCSDGKLKIANTITRSVSLCTLNFSKDNSREARFMKKIMGNKNSRKKQWYTFGDAVPVSHFPKATIGSTGGRNQRRVAVLNNVFMRYISEIMASGELSNIIVGRGIQISRVKVSSDFSGISVYWLAMESENDAEIEEILEKYSWQLRHELTQLRVIGVVPPLHFIKDKEYSKVAETPHLPSQVVEIDQVNNEGISEPPLPPMRNDVLGLKHADIMAKIKKGMKKAKAPHRQLVTSEAETEPERVEPQELIEYENIKLKNEEFTKFLMKQQIQRKKMIQGRKNYTPEMEMHETEVLENSKVAAEFMDNVDREKDYLEEMEGRRT
ncbi:hypothetical protein L9F63_007134 [Diploptera punctata]|uniref:Ribosome-binding factor A, mitochondrial n=1 Tax=Diploptera punctata TaxID=6984 RepID=A0AAD7Z8I3_DIPPU|nr:hypothetical protein L9F63_007134 [Diploptera punctata]